MGEKFEEQRRPGRPSLGAGPSVAVTVRMAPEKYDAAHARMITDRRESVPDLVRLAVDRYLASPPDDD